MSRKTVDLTADGDNDSDNNFISNQPIKKKTKYIPPSDKNQRQIAFHTSNVGTGAFKHMGLTDLITFLFELQFFLCPFSML